MTEERSASQAQPNRAGQGVEWSGLHDRTVSWRTQLLGEISDRFVLPRYIRLFRETFASYRGASFLEIGAGNGENSTAILNDAGKDIVGAYHTTEVFPDGVKWLRERGLNATLANAECLPFPDASFDGVVEFDVMHHVDNPRAMAREMLRIGRGRLLLTESNGLSLPRKLLELLPARRAAGEKSFTPRKWKSFFQDQPGFRINKIVLYPFLFPFKCPRWFLPALVWINESIEHVPVVRWQCSSVVIVIDYERI